MLRTAISATLSSDSLAIPGSLTGDFEACLEALGTVSIGWVPVEPWVHSCPNDCHNNSRAYTEWYGGNVITGYYWLMDERGMLAAIRHSIVQKSDGSFVDVTPFDDEREMNLFSVGENSLASTYGFLFTKD